MLNFLLNNILSGKFEFKKGNTLAALAETLHANFDTIFMGVKKPYYDLTTGHKIYQPPSDIINCGTFGNIPEWYFKFLKVTVKLVPFYRFYFDYYTPSKKVVVLSMLTSLRLYDEVLYSNLTG